ncbi:GNAT family N-acetyltransferase [bacterium]|jgi:ribosomal protein S18 acetylase RimI-like enzyme|nr:GNAT family N-acetyltransferase [bacterium]MBT3580991.1 GNAT family N-acetyltransferase [bacterium]MBT4551780.1 GNAT family N-acetyltransferase [bacterium]
MKIEYTENIGKEIEDALSNVFCSYAKKEGIEVNYKSFSFLIRDNNEKLIGGIVARAIYKEIHVEDLWVDEKYRGQGYGKQLLDKVWEKFSNQGYDNLNLDTYRFQAPDFYQKYGFKLDFIRKNKTNSKLDKYFFVKEFQHEKQPQFQIKATDEKDQKWIAEWLIEHWGAAKIVTRGKIHYADKLPGFIALMDNEPSGLIIYHIKDKDCEIVSLNSMCEGIGIGGALINKVKEIAQKNLCQRLWLITTNDMIDNAIFYQKKGFALVAIHKNALDVTRKIKPQVPLMGEHNIPLQDEIEIEMRL